MFKVVLTKVSVFLFNFGWFRLFLHQKKSTKKQRLEQETVQIVVVGSSSEFEGLSDGQNITVLMLQPNYHVCVMLLRSSMVLFRISFDILRWFITSFEISLTQLVHRSISKSRAFKKGDEWYFEEVVVVLSGGGEVLPISISSGLESL